MRFNQNQSCSNTEAGGTYDTAGLSKLLLQFLPGIDEIIADFASSNPGHVFLGDTQAGSYFAAHYLTEMLTQNGSSGNYYIHPTGTADADGNIGTESLGMMHAQAIARAVGIAGNVSGRSFTFF